jgi:signal transduction histidine kinase
VQEKERERIAIDLHDEIGAALSIGRMQLLQLERAAETDEEKIKSVRELIENTLTSTRRISHELMPLNLSSLGLVEALKSLLGQAEKTGEIKTNIELSPDLNSLPDLVELGLYRIYSELVNNTLKYADATALDISMVQGAEHLYCQYADNGKGLDKPLSKDGLGFRSIENRINTLQGSLKYGTNEEGGFYAQFKIPI